MRFQSLYYKFWDSLYSLIRITSEAFCWSNIGSIGKSFVGRMTVAMPLIGYLIIFNPAFIDFFQSTIPGGGVGAPQWLSMLHSMRLSFLYFGLLFIGSGMSLYLLAAPDQIKKFPSVADYIGEMEKVWSPALVWDRFTNTIRRSENYPDGVAPHAVYCVGDPSFPDHTSYYLDELISSILREQNGLLASIETNEFETPISLSRELKHLSEIANEQGSRRRLLKSVTSGSTADQAACVALRPIISEKRKEVFYLEHKSLDYERYSVRVFVAAFFIIGILLLLIPTFSTSLLVLRAS